MLTVAPMPAEKCAYALARYSRSPDSIAKSLEWVRTHDESKFLDSFYFQYGHASIADLGHVVLCFEGVSELAATELEDEQLWDGQARSSRYQDFGSSGFITPPELEGNALYAETGTALLAAYREMHARAVEHLTERLPRPEAMKPDAYQRNIAARAFDIARYCLFWGIPTGVGQVTSIRTLERQIRRLKTSEYAEVRDLGAEAATACQEPAAVTLDGTPATVPFAPTLAKYVDADEHVLQSRADVALWAAHNIPTSLNASVPDVDLLEPRCPESDIAATLVYPSATIPYRALLTFFEDHAGLRRDVIDTALRSRKRRDDLLREFRGGPFVYDIVMDIGAYRDLHRHRRCQQYRQAYGTHLGYAKPDAIAQAGLLELYSGIMERTFSAIEQLPAPGSHYLLPFAANARFLFKMDFAEAEYISRLRSGVKGHFSYRRIAWEMKRKMESLRPELGRLIEATPPEEEDPLQR
ncbi:thymidylate synthase [Bryobacterales bacterium F-183]|nr:thymidylate synthase [Bryobacterales bacterium F-183]